METIRSATVARKPSAYVAKPVPVVRTSEPGEPGSGHLLIAHAVNGSFKAECYCGWPNGGGELRTNYDAVQADWELHADRVRRGK